MNSGSTSMAKPLTAYEDVLAALSRLPPPKAGLVRVYRGQTQDHRTSDHKSTMRPSGLRRPIKTYGVWRLYAMGIAEDLRRQADRKRDSSTMAIDVYEWLFWVCAIAQHYGPGSGFLDVTRSLEVALWFALHEYVPFDTKSVIGPPGSPHPDDIPIEGVGVRYAPWTKDTGWLYVLDVVEFKDSLNHGTLLDLAKAPPVFADSPRIRAQDACLLWADSQVGGDLISCCKCDPLRVSWPLHGTPRLTARTDEMFPLPSRDPWYARFVSIPHTLGLRDDGRSCRFAQPLEVPQYIPNERPQPAAREFFERGIMLAPHLLFPAMVADRVTPPEGEWNVKWETRPPTRLADATPIYVEAPLFFGRPPIKGGWWNEGLLATDLDLATDAMSLAQGNSKRVSLENVFVEFSPLDKVGWERIEHSETESMEMLRGAWIARNGDLLVLQLFLQSFPSPDVATFSSGFIQYDPGAGKFRFRERGTFLAEVFDAKLLDAYESVKSVSFGEGDSQAVSAVEHVRRLKLLCDALSAVLTLLRDLSTGLKATPYPVGLISYPGRARAFVRIAPQVCRLVMCDGSLGYYFVRDIRRDEPYMGAGFVRQMELPETDKDAERAFARSLGGRGLSIDIPGTFAALPHESVRSAIAGKRPPGP